MRPCSPSLRLQRKFDSNLHPTFEQNNEPKDNIVQHLLLGVRLRKVERALGRTFAEVVGATGALQQGAQKTRKPTISTTRTIEKGLSPLVLSLVVEALTPPLRAQRPQRQLGKIRKGERGASRREGFRDDRPTEARQRIVGK